MNSDIRILIVEDQAEFRTVLELYASSIEHFKCSVATNYKEAIEILEEQVFDVLVLDIKLGEQNKTGLDIARFVRTNDTSIPIIFISQHFNNEYYELVKDVGASSFLNKEVSRLKFQQAVELAVMNIQSAKIKRQVTRGSLLVKVGGIYKKFPIEDIPYIFTQKKGTYLHKGNIDYPLNMTLTDLANKLEGQFIRVHQSYLVNIEKVSSIDTRQSLLLIGDKSIPIGYKYRKETLSIFTFLK